MPQTKTSLLVLTNFETGVRYYHSNDERAFFEWSSRIPCVKSFSGEGCDRLVVRLKRRPGNDDLRQFLALCHEPSDMRVSAATVPYVALLMRATESDQTATLRSPNARASF
jgi:hypothetical protein